MRRRWLAVWCLAALACNDEQRQLSARLYQLETRRTTLTQRLETRRRAANDAESRLDTLTHELTAHNTDMHAFLADHRVAAACIRTARTSWGEGDPSGGQRVGTVLCSLALLRRDFAREVDLVTATVAKGDARSKELNERIASIRQTVGSYRKQIGLDQGVLEGLESEMADVRSRLTTR